MADFTYDKKYFVEKTENCLELYLQNDIKMFYKNLSNSVEWKNPFNGKIIRNKDEVYRELLLLKKYSKETINPQFFVKEYPMQSDNTYDKMYMINGSFYVSIGENEKGNIIQPQQCVFLWYKNKILSFSVTIFDNISDYSFCKIVNNSREDNVEYVENFFDRVLIKNYKEKDRLLYPSFLEFLRYDKGDFVQVHRNYFVHKNCITNFCNRGIITISNTYLPLSRKYYKNIKIKRSAKNVC